MANNFIVYDMGPIDGGLPECREGFDYVFVAAGSDRRAYHVLREISQHNMAVTRIVLFDFSERREALKPEDPYFAWQTLNMPIQPLECSLFRPEDAIRSLIAQYPDISQARIALDVSCFTTPYVFTLLRVFKDMWSLAECLVLYTEPESYVFDGGRHSFYRATSGPLELREIPSFQGRPAVGAHQLLVVLLGFDSEMSEFVLTELAPDATIVIGGLPAYLPKFKDISLVNNEKVLNAAGGARSLRYSSASDPFHTFNLLQRIKHEHASAMMNIAPLGTKPMSLGACMFALADATARVVYPLPSRYLPVTTEDSWRTWYYRIPLEALRSVE